MTGEMLEPATAEAPSIAASEIALGVRERGHSGVAILLALAAVAAAVIGARASMVSSDANDSWQSALRTEVKRSAAAINDVQSLYLNDLPVAVQVLRAKELAESMQAAQAGQTPAVQRALALEASVDGQLVDALTSSSDLAGGSAYALPAGGYDLGKRLADIRARSPDLVALNPDAIEATGDRLAQKALLLTFALIPTGLCALLGVLAQPLRRYRRQLLGSGIVALCAGVAMAVGVEVLA